MAHPDDYDFYLESGCEDWSDTLGAVTMPDSYALMLNADQSHFFWMQKATGRESSIHWDRWAVYRGVKADALRQKEGETNG